LPPDHAATRAAGPQGRLAENVVHFARVLRAAGLPLGTDRVLLALRALQLAGLGSRDDFRAVLAACLIDRAEHRELFEQAFELFWRDPDVLGRIMAMRMPGPPQAPDRRGAAQPSRRLANALFPSVAPAASPASDEADTDHTFGFSARERLRKADFETMSAQEWIAARRLIEQWRARLPRIATRRFEPAPGGSRLDWRRTAARSVRTGGELASFAWRRRRRQTAPLVALIDISGSMSRYSRMFLHFLHSLTAAERRTQSFLFGTRLSPVTRMLRRRDPDRAVEECVRAVDDWSGGTRIAGCLREFNLRWARRVLGQGATVLLVTDGLERDDAGALALEAERLGKSCRRLVWLNPLLRYDAFEPKAAGVRALLPHVDRHLPVHNLDSLAGLADALYDLSRHPRPESRNHARWSSPVNNPSRSPSCRPGPR
jgi:hypothetical protein